jgi:hypothetical protein
MLQCKETEVSYVIEADRNILQLTDEHSSLHIAVELRKN